MESSGKNSMFKIVLVSAATTLSVLLVVAALGGTIYYFAFRDGPAHTAEKPETLSDKLRRAERTLGLSSTDASKITAISYSSWRHAGPLYPAPNDPSGYVSGSTVAFRRDLTATSNKGKNYDRASEPDELSESTGKLTEQQFQKLAQICAKYDLVNEQHATGNITESGSNLNIEYNGEAKRIVTSNTGSNSPGVSELLKAIAELEKNVAWKPAGR